MSVAYSYEYLRLSINLSINRESGYCYSCSLLFPHIVSLNNIFHQYPRAVTGASNNFTTTRARVKWETLPKAILQTQIDARAQTDASSSFFVCFFDLLVQLSLQIEPYRLEQ